MCDQSLSPEFVLIGYFAKISYFCEKVSIKGDVSPLQSFHTPGHLPVLISRTFGLVPRHLFQCGRARHKVACRFASLRPGGFLKLWKGRIDEFLPFLVCWKRPFSALFSLPMQRDLSPQRRIIVKHIFKTWPPFA